MLLCRTAFTRIPHALAIPHKSGKTWAGSLLRPSRACPVRGQNTYALPLRFRPASFYPIFCRSCRSDGKQNIANGKIYVLHKKCAKAAGGTALGVKVCGWVVRYGIE